MSSLYFIIAAVIVATNAETQQCSSDTTCSCTQNDTCRLECIGKQKCKGSILNCKQSYPCVIVCDSNNETEACLDTTINANGATKVQVICSGEKACKSSIVNCDTSLACSSRCTGTLGCEGTNVNCGQSACSLSCESQNTCKSIQVDAAIASSFNCYNDCTNSGIPDDLPTTTSAPNTKNPTTIAPTTANPTTKYPTTKYPTTKYPTTKYPTTVEPTTMNPTTVSPTTMNPTTINPTTHEPTTFNPTTFNPTTINPTTHTTSYSPTSDLTTSDSPTSHSATSSDSSTTKTDSKSGLVRETDVTSQSSQTDDSNDNVQAMSGFTNMTEDAMIMSIAGAGLLILVVLLICCFVFCKKYRNRIKAPQEVIKMNSNTLYFKSNMTSQNRKVQQEGDGLEYEGDVTTNKNSIQVFEEQNNNIPSNYVMIQGQAMNTNGYPIQHNMMPNLPPVPAPPEIIVTNDAIMTKNDTKNLSVKCDLESPDSPLTATVDTPIDMSPIGFETPVGVVDTLTMMVQKHTNETDRGNDLELIQENNDKNDESEDECFDDDEEVLNDMGNVLTTPGHMDVPPVPTRALPEILIHNDNETENEMSDTDQNLEMEQSDSLDMFTPVPDDNENK